LGASFRSGPESGEQALVVDTKLSGTFGDDQKRGDKLSYKTGMLGDQVLKNEDYTK
jgi:hypothetical protein